MNDAPRSLLERALAHIQSPDACLPMDLRRRAPETIAEELGCSAAEVLEQLERKLEDDGKSDETRRTRWLRRHWDGRFSYSAHSVFEGLRYPLVHDLERAVDERGFSEVDALLAGVGAKRSEEDRHAPPLRWRNGAALSEHAMNWLLLHLRRGKYRVQPSKRYRHKAVADAFYLLHGALDEDSVRALSGWLLRYRGPKKTAPYYFPVEPAGLAELERFLQQGGSERRVLVHELRRSRDAARILLRVGLVSPGHPLVRDFHGLWPRDASGSAEWQRAATRFLDDAQTSGFRFRWQLLAEHYLDHPLFERELKQRKWTLLQRDADSIIREKRRRIREDVQSDLPVTLTEGGPSVALDPQDLLVLSVATEPNMDPPPPFPHHVFSVDEWYRRCRKAELIVDRDRNGAPYAFAVFPRGTLEVWPSPYGRGYGGTDKSIRIERVLTKDGRFRQRTLAYDRTACEGWDELEGPWREMVRAKLRILFAPLKRAGEGAKLEQAKSGRASCRGCGEKITKGTWRLGVPYAIAQSTSGRVGFGWWHLECALKGARDALAVALEGDGFPEAPEWRVRVNRAQLD